MTRLWLKRIGLVGVVCAALAVSVRGQAPAAGRVRFSQPLLGVGVADPLFDDTVVHEINLTPNAADWQTLKDRYLENTYYPADFRWGNVVVRNIGIRSRGTGSRNPVKPGLTVDFDRYRSGQRFMGLDTLVLRNNTQDPTNMHERLAMKLFQRLGIKAPRESYARLFVNGEYLGLYTIVESVDAPFLKRSFGDDSGYLYDYDYPPSAPPYRFEYLGDDPAAYVPQPFKPQTRSSSPRADVILRLVQDINLSSDAAFRTSVGAFIDFEELLRWVAADVFIGNNDGMLGDWGMNNFYLYRLEGRTRFFFIPWDESHAFQSPTYSIWHNIFDVPDPLRNRLMQRVLGQADLFARYLDMLELAAASANEPTAPDGRGWLAREIEREYAQIRTSALSDTKKPFTNEEFEAGVADLLRFAATRGAFVAGQVASARQ